MRLFGRSLGDGPIPASHFSVVLRNTVLMKLAWELTSDQFGSRATLYEYFHSGDPVQNMARRHATETSSLFARLLERALSDMDDALIKREALT